MPAIARPTVGDLRDLAVELATESDPRGAILIIERAIYLIATLLEPSRADRASKAQREIDSARRRAAIPFDVAMALRKVLDAARDDYGATAWADDDIESQVLDLLANAGAS